MVEAFNRDRAIGGGDRKIGARDLIGDGVVETFVLTGGAGVFA